MSAMNGDAGQTEESQHYVTIFRSRLRPGVDAAYGPVADETEERARQADGFVDFATFAAADGERVSIVVFDSAEHHAAWREDPLHREAQRLGREQFYEEFDITVCRPLRHQRWRHDGAS